VNAPRRPRGGISWGAQRGQSMLEYIVIGAVLMGAMFFIDVDGQTVAQRLADVIRLFYANLTFFLSLP
jgi:hypothetical protein